MCGYTMKQILKMIKIITFMKRGVLEKLNIQNNSLAICRTKSTDLNSKIASAQLSHL